MGDEGERDRDALGSKVMKGKRRSLEKTLGLEEHLDPKRSTPLRKKKRMEAIMTMTLTKGISRWSRLEILPLDRLDARLLRLDGVNREDRRCAKFG